MNSRNFAQLLRYRCQALFRFLVGLLLLAGHWGRPVLAGAARPSAKPPPWDDSDDSPLLRHLRQLPLPHERSLAYWQAQVRAYPDPGLGRLVRLDRLAEAQSELGLPTTHAAYLAAWRLAARLPNIQGRAEHLLMLAMYHTQQANYDSAATYLPLAEQQFRLARNRGGVVRCLLQLGRSAEQQGHYAASLRYMLQAVALAATGNTRPFRTTGQIQLARLYTQVGDYTEAQRYLQAALYAATRYDYPDRLNLALQALGEVYYQQRQWAPAQACFMRSLAISQGLHDEPLVLALQFSLAQLHEAQEKWAQAAADGGQLLARLRVVHLPLLVPRAQALLARVALRQGQVAAAVAYGRHSLASSRQAHLLLGVAEAEDVLAEAYTRQRAFGLALQALRRYTSAHDSLLGDNTRRRVALLQLREQQAQIMLLTQRSRLATQQQELEHLRTRQQLLAVGGTAILLLLLAGTAFRRYRRRQQAQQELIATALRQRLAADLHDDVGNLLTQISLHSSLLRETPHSPAQTAARLDAMALAARQAAQQMSDVVWGLGSKPLHLRQLLDRMRDHAQEVLPPAGLDVRFLVPADLPDPKLPPTLGHNLYLIYKEALHNVVKHARATTVTVQLAAEADLVLTVADDGCGHDGQPRLGGHGLMNMQARAQAVGGTVCHKPQPVGFTVVVALPLGRPGDE